MFRWAKNNTYMIFKMRSVDLEMSKWNETSNQFWVPNFTCINRQFPRKTVIIMMSYYFSEIYLRS